MAFTDPQSVTINSQAISMPRVESAGSKSIYRDATSEHTFTISHQKTGKKRVRHAVRIDSRSIVADPLTSVNDYEELSTYLVIDEPEYGFTDTEIQLVLTGFLAWFTSGNVAKVLGNEH